MNVDKKDLILYNSYGGARDNGYRVVYFYKDYYKVGAYASEIENFMYDFVEDSPIEDTNDVPKFISVDDILERKLNTLPDIFGVAIYNINGDLVSKKEKNLY